MDCRAPDDLLSEEILPLMTNENKYEIVVRHRKPYFARNWGKKQKTTTIPCRRWTDLPEDLVGEVMVRLSAADQIRFAGCCKMLWSSMPNYNRGEIDQLPWLVNLSTRHSMNQSSFCYILELFDPVHKTPYSETCLREVTGKEGFSKDGTRLLCSRNSWLLYYWRKYDFHHGEYRLFISLVLVSPFTKQVIGLPDLYHTYFTGDPIVASYSCDPSSPDCVYCVKRQTYNPEYVIISTIRNGDTEWKIAKFDRFRYEYIDMVYHMGSFYCMSARGSIAAYCVVRNEWGLVARPKPASKHRFWKRYSYLLVWEGKLVCVFLEVSYSQYNGQGDRCIVLFYDVQKGDWVEKKSLGYNNALVLSGTGSFVVRTSSHMSNKIYYHGRISGKKKYFCLDDGKAYECESCCWPRVARCGTWIEPPQLHSHAVIQEDTMKN